VIVIVCPPPPSSSSLSWSSLRRGRASFPRRAPSWREQRFEWHAGDPMQLQRERSPWPPSPAGQHRDHRLIDADPLGERAL